MKVNSFVILLMAGLVSGCAHLSISPEEYLASIRQQLIQKQREPAYIDGYVDGCSTGRRLAGNTTFHFRKLISRFDRDIHYAAGWQDGRKYCLKKSTELDRKLLRQHNAQELTEKRRQLERERHTIEAEQYKIWQQLKK